jgi:hypothetical protein
MSELSNEFLVYLPERYYIDDILKYYPIIAADLDVANLEELIKFLWLCTPIAAFEFNYLVIAFTNKENQIIPDGLKVPMEVLNVLKVAIETNDEGLTQTISPPFPEEIGKQFLGCFAKRYELGSHVPTGYEGIDNIAELLWKYSCSVKELSSESDSDYLLSIKNELQRKVFSSLESFKNKMPVNEYTKLTEICEATFNGIPFDDIQLNNFNNKLISKVLEYSR